MMARRKLISFDWALKRLLRSKTNYEVLEGFLSELLKEDMEILEILESESNRYDARDKSNRVDMKVRNRKGEIILIEVQYEREFDFLQRILYATAKAITEHMDKAALYENVIKVISINILYFDLGYGEDYIYHGKTHFTGTHCHDELLLNEKQQQAFGKEYPHELYPEYYLLKINQFDDIAREPLDEWVYFLKNEEIKEEFQARGLKKAKEVLDIMSLSEEEQRAYEWHIEEMRYRASVHRTKVLEEQFEREEGRAQEKATVARLMKEEGEPMEKIAKYTGLMPEEIEKL
ncbi:MAG: Rpn family recombination-promoting nuclease/putative transposase [Gammaproteobacteria bacterium]|nr:Rpn family recombination-promoting nuclease/putative transposase [Gammaproteobacteria bacterium]NNJ83318.1 Rpn family recombination-promoting nuclease/putative transposase [Gammaproteobacteria bacterium]